MRVGCGWTQRVGGSGGPWQSQIFRNSGNISEELILISFFELVESDFGRAGARICFVSNPDCVRDETASGLG